MIKRRNTHIAEAVLEILKNATKALSQDAVLERLALEADRVTIYRVLNRFFEDGIVHRIVADDGKQYFALQQPSAQGKPAAEHFHFRCTTCQSIECMLDSTLPSFPKAYKVERMNCLLIGVCKSCLNEMQST